MNEDVTPANGDSEPSCGDSGPGDDVRYQFMTVKALRGREGATRTKWQNQGWEFVDQTQGTLRTEMNFRKVKPKGVGAYLSQGFAAFRGLEPKTQKTALAGVGGVLAVLIIGGTVAAAVGGDDDAPKAAKPAAIETEKPSESPEPSEEPTAEPTDEPIEDSEAAEPSETPETEPYSYQGPKYEVVITDKVPAAANLNQYWVLTKPSFDFSSDDYQEQVKLIFADIAHEEGTADFLAEVVTHEDIAKAEALSTSLQFNADRGDDYTIKTIPKMEVKGWVASYTGGFDYDTGKTSDDAYEIIWRPYATSEIEQWKAEPGDVVESDEPEESGAARTETQAAEPKPKPKPKPAALQERTAIDFLAKAWEARFSYGGDVNDLMGLLDVAKNSDGSYYIEVTADVENAFGEEYDAVVVGTVAGTDARPRIVRSTITSPGGGTIGYYE